MNSQEEKRQKIIEEIARVAKEKGKRILSRGDFLAATGISQRGINQCFDGWRDACEQAGISAHASKTRIDESLLFDDMRRVFIEQGGICAQLKFSKLAKYSVDVLRRRYGAWPNILATFREWLIAESVDFPYLDSLPTGVADTSVANGAEKAVATRTAYLVPPQPGKGPKYGAFLNFRGLQHAPVNEQGVVFLFGMVCHELGFAVELVRTGFPDCEAKRCIDTRRDTWERVRIEFEFRAANAKVHPMSGCDLIVCWENDWPDCPVEVIELKTAIRALNGELGASSI